ncbi:MAG TPA: AsmA-like C-terminal region-containing protein [Candidatus Hydrogenedentes bacterium]|nr:AsmA-like C-terminal region-containing protein [Candidatus Hydrogenedentota bacterium]
MNETAHPLRKSWLRRHKWLAALAVLAVLLIVAIQVAEYFVHIDRYRDQVVRMLEDRTGMPVSIQRLELALFPQPSVAAYNISIGEGELQAQCAEARAAATWNGLMSRQIHVTEVDFRGLVAALPREIAVLRDRIAYIQEKMKARPAPPTWKIAVDRVRARSARISVSGFDQPVFEGNLDVRDVLTGAIPLTLDGALPFLGEPSRGEAELLFTVQKDAEPLVVPSGWIAVSGVDPRRALDREAMPPLVFEVRATFDEVTAELIGMQVTGEAVAAEGAPELLQAAAGPFNGTLWIRGSEITLNDLTLTAPSLTALADATRTADGAIACELQDVQVRGDALAAVYAMVNSERLQLVPQKDAAITATNMLVGVDAEGALRLVNGQVQFAGVQPTLADGSRPFGDIQGRVHLDEGVVQIDEITGSGLAVRGSVRPDLKRAGASVDLEADLTLSPGVVAAFLKDNTRVKGLSGHMAFKRIAGTFEQGKPLPDDLKIDGVLEKAQATLVLGKLEETLTGISGRFAAEPGAVKVTGSCTSSLLGPVSADARITPEEQRVTGVLQADLARLNLPFPEDETGRNAVMNVASAYGASAFDVKVTLPTANAPVGAVRITRQGAPELSATVVLARDKDAIFIASADTRAVVPLAAIRELAPGSVRLDGTAAVTAAIPMNQDSFEAHVDLAQAALRIGQYVNKQPGDPATADVLIARVNDAWKPRTVTLHYGGEDLVARFEGDRIVSDFELEVASLRPLFAGTVQADGQARGSLKTNPVELEMQLENCVLALSDTLRFDSLSGRVAYAGNTPRVDNLAVRGLNSDFTLALHATPEGVWQGTVRGNQLDVDSVTAALRGFKGDDTAADAPKPATKKSPPPVNLDVQVAKVLYRTAEVGDVRARVTGRDGVYDIRDLALAPGGGAVTGTAQVRMAAGPGPSTIALDLALNNVDLAAVDGLAFPAPRGLKGATSGTVKLTAPFGGGLNPTHGATGTVQFVSRNGTLGRLGIATKILTIMRTTEIIRLRMPPTKDEGITFDTCEAKAVLDSGFMTIEQFDLKSPTLAMAAKGTMDFPRNATDMTVDIHLLQMATQVLDIVKLDGVADEIRKQSSYRLAISGPPDDPKVSVQGLTTGEGLTGPVTGAARDAAKTGQQTVVDVIQGSAGILRDILGGGGQKQQPAPQEEQKPEAPAPQPAP